MIHLIDIDRHGLSLLEAVGNNGYWLRPSKIINAVVDYQVADCFNDENGFSFCLSLR